MDGVTAVFEATGQYPVYPGHPLTVAWAIMSVFSTPAEALESIRQGGLNCPNAVADNRISGGGGEVRYACDLLRRAVGGMSAEDLVSLADTYWVDGQAGGHIKAVQPGLAQAEKLKPLFAAKLTNWLATNAAAGWPREAR